MLKIACLNYTSNPIRYGPIPPRPLDIGSAVDQASREGLLSGLDFTGKIEQRLKSNINSPTSTAE